MIDLIAILALTLAANASDERYICVPSFDASGWDCGKGADAPAPRALPQSQRRSAESTPPPYLMDPSKLPELMGATAPPADYSAQPSATAPEPVAAAEPVAVPEPAAVAEPMAAPEPAAASPPAAVAESAAPPQSVAPASPAPVPAPEPAAAPTPVAEAAAAGATVASAEVARTPAAGAAPAPPATPPVVATPTGSPSALPPTRSISSVARDAAELLSLPGSGYTVQLAAARGVQGFAAFRQQLGVAVEDTFVIRVRRGGDDWWLMLWRDFADLDSARSAAATLAAHGSFWPRRLAPLQAEVRATPD